MIDASPRSSVFDALLELNPWARPHWDRRLEMIEAETWNINYPNQGGNAETRRWLNDFFPARARATEVRLTSGAHPEWNAGVYDIVVPLFSDRDFAEVHVGTPLKPVSSGWLANNDKQVVGYSLGQFKADVLLLAQPDLYDMTISVPLDLSGLAFTIGLRTAGADLSDVTAHETQFGPYARFSSSRLGRFDAAGAEFFDQVDFTPSTFRGDAIFAGAVFHGGLSMQAVSFDAACDFTGAVFHGWTAFAGSVFHEVANFREAEFHKNSTFKATTYHASANFTGATFHRGVGTSGIQDREVAKMILAAKR